jgi:hypothetical protein
MTLDLTAALAAFYAGNTDQRGDEEFAHVSDLSFCRRKTWLRRTGEPQIATADTKMRLKWAIGNAVEDHVLGALGHSLEGDGWRLERDVRVALDAAGNGRILASIDRPKINEVVGHLDGLLIRNDDLVVLETKSTSFLRGRIPDTPSAWYVSQAAAYAVATGAERFAVFIVCRESGRIAEFWFETANHRDAVLSDVRDVLTNTDPLAHEPEAAPRFGFECKYCPAASCPQNTNPANDHIPVAS